jgi:hypothetical protein
VYLGKTLFAQIMDFLPWKRFHRIVARRKADHYVKHFSCAEQFRVMAFAQLSYRESLRDIELYLGAQEAKLYHMGLSQPVKRTTLAEANERRDWRLFAEFAQCLIDEARGLYADKPVGIDLAGSAYAFDASTIDLCLSLFPWAHENSLSLNAIWRSPQKPISISVPRSTRRQKRLPVLVQISQRFQVVLERIREFVLDHFHDFVFPCFVEVNLRIEPALDLDAGGQSQHPAKGHEFLFQPVPALEFCSR